MFLAALVAATALVPLLNQAVPVGSALHMPAWLVSLAGRFLCLALLALSLDLIWGYCGIFSLGHGAFFGLGGYAMGLHFASQAEIRAGLGQSDSSEAVAAASWIEPLWSWPGFESAAVAATVAIVAPVAVAFAFGWLAFRARISGIHFAVLSLALTYSLMFAFSDGGAGSFGTDGMPAIWEVFGFDVESSKTRCGLFAASAIALALAYLGCRLAVTSGIGRMLVEIRDREEELKSRGHDTGRAKLVAFSVSAAIAGAAGALHVTQAGMISPSEFSPAASIEIAICVALAGRGSLHGTAIAAIVLSTAKAYFTGVWPEGWPFIFGALCIVGTLLLPKGLFGSTGAFESSLSGHFGNKANRR